MRAHDCAAAEQRWVTVNTRRVTPEFMDDPKADRDEQREALRFIRLVNRRLGGTAATMLHFKRWAREWTRDQVIRIVDVGTGSADIPVAISEWAAKAGFRVHITGIDLHPVTLDLAREFAAHRHDIEFVQANALQLMDRFEAGSFDYAHAGMFLHHLPDIEVMTVLRIMDRLAKRGVIWNDLVRGWIGGLGVRALTSIGVPPHVRHDAIVSVAAGFTKGEAIDLGQRAGLRNIRYRRHLLHRFTLVKGNRQ